MKTSAGLVIIYQNKILLVHPTNAPWYGTYSIPKGEIEEGEDLLEAAIRETKEEIGITYDRIYIDKTPHMIEYKDSKGNIYKTVMYFIIKVPAPPIEIKLQLEEIDHAGFYDKEEAEKRILPKLSEVLNCLKPNENK
jgi:ADP-ribose pyrophosphatase YjhB (NUDIX family)